MQVSRVSQQNNTNFGIKYLNKEVWNKQALETFEKSNLLKSIDQKFPKAEIFINKFHDYEDESHTLSALLKLGKDKFYRWTLSSHSEDVPNEHFINFIKTATLENVEAEAVNKLEPMYTISIDVNKTATLEEVEAKAVNKPELIDAANVKTYKTSIIDKVKNSFKKIFDKNKA